MMRGDEIKFLFADRNDEPEIKQLLKDSELHHTDITPGKLKHFLLSWDGPQLVAVVGLEIKNDCALLRSLAVDAEYRNRRIATRLVGEIEDYAKTLKVDTVYLLTLTAEAFFNKIGYRRTARDSAPSGIQETTEFKNLCPASAACMFKHLSANQGGFK